ncbi:hypothetical protein CMI41_04555 [Candidatus Pacearchaeota archaeon]|nr:hypothetical protein [Candidatus Pacearchaeota archaeon]|tara:strand:- start:12475 stop:12699 length:225 start_codon:yes stop_codon:yes gene_type:complete
MTTERTFIEGEHPKDCPYLADGCDSLKTEDCLGRIDSIGIKKDISYLKCPSYGAAKAFDEALTACGSGGLRTEI